MNLYFLTSNKFKFKVAKKILEKYNINLLQEKTENVEIQNLDLGKVASFAALYASRRLGKPFIKVDCGLFINALNGFPGAYTSDINKTIGYKGILKLMESIEDRSALWKDALAFATPSGFSKVFISKTPHEIVLKPRGQGEWPLDSIMKPINTDKVLAQMDTEEMLKHWKTTVFNQLGSFLKNNYNE